MQILDIFFEQSALILTGVFITFISSVIYRITPTGFVSAGKYRTKEGAIAIYLLAAVLLGVFTPFIYQLCIITIRYVPIISIIGLLIFIANLVINQSVPNWRHTTPKTLLIYGLSIAMIIFGFFIKF